MTSTRPTYLRLRRHIPAAFKTSLLLLAPVGSSTRGIAFRGFLAPPSKCDELHPAMRRIGCQHGLRMMDARPRCKCGRQKICHICDVMYLLSGADDEFRSCLGTELPKVLYLWWLSYLPSFKGPFNTLIPSFNYIRNNFKINLTLLINNHHRLTIQACCDGYICIWYIWKIILEVSEQSSGKQLGFVWNF